MKAYELFKNVKPSIVQDLFMWMREADRDLYKTALSSLAANKKLRPAFVQKKSVVDQISWMHKNLQIKTADMIGGHILHAYFMQGQEEMLATFCDSLEIKHDGKGQVEENLPETLDTEKLKAAVNTLLEKYDPALVALYLHTFNLQTADGWDALDELLAKDDSIKLS